MKKSEVKEVFGRLEKYVKCQRTDLQPIFMSRLLKIINELKEVIENGNQR